MLFRTLPTLIPRVSYRYASTQAYIDLMSRLKTDLKESMIKKDDVKKTTIKGLLSAIKNMEIDNKDKDYNEFMLQDIFFKQLAQRKGSIVEFKKNYRDDLVAKELAEIDIIAQYLASLPVSTKDELEANVLEFLGKLKYSQDSIKMPEVMRKLDWKTIPNEWKASPKQIKVAIAENFKKVFE
ncbi:HHL052Wp [Eremothecium sinecaudum]|uniref:Altered inheritance of mitochondria protein 41 n=1 Tax=Eremothecium sinecaudum TaxID=45286 RepID=A0A0X8HWI7_9SACH|nr:HHL052Wp [Eremothecium sinecaudum]AMD22718.1 HHL052Wp [Eremothecium sinecaudum]